MAGVLTPSLPPDARELWDDFMFLMLSDRSGYEAALRRVIQAEPAAAAPRAVAALFGWFGDPGFDPDTEIAAARSGRGAADWERSLVAAVARTIEDGPWVALEDWTRHHDRYPGDLVAFSFAAYFVLVSTAPDRRDRVAAMAERTHAAVGDEPSVLGALAMIAQEAGDLDRAHDLADRVLAADPGHFHGAHPMAHVYFESGEHEAGLRWLDGWLEQADRDSDWFAHLNWHSALHVLGSGDAARAVERYLQCTRLQGVTSLVDRTSLLWRCQLHGLVPAGEDPAEPPTLALAEKVRAEPPTTFVGFHVALALAGRRDADGLRALAASLPRLRAPGAAELLPPVVHGLTAFVEGDYAAAADRLAGALPGVQRLGGSRAQREVVEDTLIEALIRAERLEQAAVLLERRLDRRESALDRHWLSRTRRVATSG